MNQTRITECPHLDRPHKARGRCASCYNTYLINRTPEYREQYLARQRERYRPALTSEQRRDNHLLHRYGLTPEDYDRLLEQQGGNCGVCQEPWRNRLYVDHDHDTNEVRALLCPGCNTLVGIIEKQPLKVERALALLQRNREDNTDKSKAS